MIPLFRCDMVNTYVSGSQLPTVSMACGLLLLCMLTFLLGRVWAAGVIYMKAVLFSAREKVESPSARCGLTSALHCLCMWIIRVQRASEWLVHAMCINDWFLFK